MNKISKVNTTNTFISQLKNLKIYSRSVLTLKHHNYTHGQAHSKDELVAETTAQNELFHWSYELNR